MSHNTDHLVRPEEAVTLHGLFLERARRSPQSPAYRHFDGNSWKDISWNEAKNEVGRWQAALLAEGLSPGDRVGIMLKNCPEWVYFDQAAMSLGLVVVPLYTVDRPENVAYISKDAGIRVLVFENQWKSLKGVSAELDCIRRFVSLTNVDDPEEQRLLPASKWLPENAELAELVPRDREALATIIYTSGTTGHPKGVMLSHHNIVYNAYAGLLHFPIGPGDVMLSFLPLSHSFERTVGYYISIMAGSTVAFSRSIQLLLEDMQIVRPTILVSVPRIYERIYNSIQVSLEKGSPFSRMVFSMTEKTGWRRFEHQQNRASWHPSLLLWPILKRLAADKVLGRFGGRLRLSISG
ncbi:MAG TPA: AMP-binding protein [Burkholderiales bacterium]|nr:AMP-binding protein [Burkholderiales bacterium]